VIVFHLYIVCIVYIVTGDWTFPGFNTHHVPMDGNCMFASIAHQLYTLGIDKVQKTADAVRMELVNMLEADSELAARVVQGFDPG